MAANRRKVLVPLATLMVAGSVAVGSGASFTSTTASTTTVTSGSVTHANDVSNLAITNIKDDDVITGSVTITNTGTLPADLTIAETSAGTPNDGKAFVTGGLKYTLTQGATQVYTGNFGSMVDGQGHASRLVVEGSDRHVRVTVTVDGAVHETGDGGPLERASAVVDTMGGRMSGDLGSPKGLALVLPRR